ncbi:MAG: hypothetical protein N3A61_08640, partial [Ignavibacteria bacterium]|nr:hypothetical protein [Ignavibacteria bacterium]
PIVKLNATTGATIRNYGIPITAPYGIAFDKFNQANDMSLWMAEPSDNTAFRLSRVDTINGLIDYTLDLTSKFPSGAISGGLEIMNNHPSYPNKIIAVVVVQLTGTDYLAFIDITNAPQQSHYVYELEVNNHLGGWINIMFARGNNAFVAHANAFTIYDISGSNLQKLSYLTFREEIFAMAVSGNYAYVGYGWNSGNFEIIDITNPQSPTKLMSTPLQFPTSVKSIFVSGNYAFLSFGDTYPHRIINISNPSAPTLVATVNVSAHNIFASGNYAYIVGANKFKIIDITNISNPTELSNINITGARYIDVSGNYAYVSCGNLFSDPNGMWIIDISNPNSPSITSTFGIGSNAMSIG